MKINIQKIVKLGTTFCAVLSLVLFSFVTPVRADIVGTSINAMDYVVDTTIVGDTKTVTFKFIGVNYCVNVWTQPSGVKSFCLGYTPGRPWSPTWPDACTGFSSRTYFFGSEAFDNKPAPSGVLDVSDIMPGASLDLVLGYDMSFEYSEYNVSATGDLIYSQGAFFYDSDGSYVETIYFPEYRQDISLSGSEIFRFDFPASLTIPSGISYILPFVSINMTMDSGYYLNSCNVYFIPSSFEMSVDINMIYENSQTMDAIKDQLGDISQGIQDTNDKLDDVNDAITENNEKLDEIITGGETGEASKESSDALKDAAGELQDAVDKMEEVKENIPTTPSNFDNIIDSETDASIDEALDNAELLFDWKASGLEKMFAPMGLSCSLSTLFYVIFGKRG